MLESNPGICKSMKLCTLILDPQSHFKDWRQSVSGLCQLWRPFLKTAATADVRPFFTHFDSGAISFL